MDEWKNSRWLGYGLSISGGVMWAVAGSCGQALFRSSGVTASWLVPVRLCIAGVLFLLIACVRRSHPLRIWGAPSDILKLALFSILGIAASQYTFYYCIELSNVAFSTVMCYICPIFILCYTILRARRGPRLYEVCGVLLVLVGVFSCATHFDLSSLSVSPAALVSGVLCALTSAVYTLAPLSLMKRFGLFPVLGWGMLMGGVVMTVLFHPWQLHPAAGPRLILFMAVIILGGTVFSSTAYMLGTRLVGPVAAVVLSSMEPITAVILSVLVLNVSFTNFDFLGFFLILLTIPVISIGQQRENRRIRSLPLSEKP